jgi:hypothetical protein|tara:strand:- start:427 stop:630 length:204 start_codon:yes stop_codon:yes gene_type:complete
MQKARVIKLIKESTVMKGATLPKDTELEVVNDVVYMGGFPIPPEMQGIFLNWIDTNPKLFKDDTRPW